MIPYDTNYNPPAVVITVTVAGIVHHRPQVEVPALIDTGADITAVPDHLVDKLKLYPFGRLTMEDAKAMKTPVLTYEAILTLTAKTTKKMEVILTPFPFVILGRDWLKDYYLLLDGPGKQFRLSKEPIQIVES